MIRDILNSLIEQHEDHMERAHEMLIEGRTMEEMATYYAYGAGLHKAISTIEVILRSEAR
jgi:hypothetical protein